MSGPTSFALCSTLALAVALAVTSEAGDWVTVGGTSQHDGRSDELGPAGPDVLWSGSVQALFGGQCFIEGRRLATMRFQTINVTPIVGYDLDTGAQLWSVDFPGANSRSVPRGMRDGKVYATNFQETGMDTLYALDADTGAEIWKSEVRCERGIVWSIAFAPDGDLLVPATGNDIARVEQTDGSLVWVAPRIIPNTGAEGLAVFGNTVYGFEGTITTPKVLTAWDLDDGSRKYSSPGLPGDGDQENPLTIGDDGTIYVKRDGGRLYAFTDTGAALVEKWSVTTGSLTYSGHFGVGTDGSVYVPDGTVLVRLDPEDGAVVSTSGPLVSGSTLNPRFAIARDGTLYVGNCGSADGRLYVLAPDLQELWSRAVPGMVYGGPALGADGTLAVAGSGTFLEVYRSDITELADDWDDWGAEGGPEGAPAIGAGNRIAVFPNPVRDHADIRLRLDEPDRVCLTLHDATGRRLATLFDDELRAGEHRIAWGPDAGAARGRTRIVYLRAVGSGWTDSRRVVIR